MVYFYCEFCNKNINVSTNRFSNICPTYGHYLNNMTITPEERKRRQRERTTYCSKCNLMVYGVPSQISVYDLQYRSQLHLVNMDKNHLDGYINYLNANNYQFVCSRCLNGVILGQKPSSKETEEKEEIFYCEMCGAENLKDFKIGVLNDFSGVKKKRFDEFLLFLEALALNLRHNYSPEIAFIKSYSDNKSRFSILKETFNLHISNLVSLQYTFEDLINRLKLELNSPRYKIILDAINTMLEKSASYSSDKISDIINIIERHGDLKSDSK